MHVKQTNGTCDGATVTSATQPRSGLPAVADPAAVDMATVGAHGPSGPPAPPALDDESALQAWLLVSRHRSQQTWRSYNNEARRFQLFLTLMHPERANASERRYLLRDATEADVLAYEATLGGRSSITGQAAPTLHLPAPERGAQPGRGRPKAAPFSRALKRSSLNQALSILRALYEFWRQPDPRTGVPYVIVNPVSRVRKITGVARRKTARAVPKEAILAMRQCLDLQLDAATRTQDRALAAQIERRRWIFCLLFGLWGRRTEISSLRMGDFRLGARGWEVELFRKGGKVQTLPMASFLVNELRRYRVSLGMEPMPSPGELSAAIQRLRQGHDANDPVTDQMIYREVKRLAHDTATALSDGVLSMDLPPERSALVVQQLRSFSPHWFRHSGASIAINSGAMSLEEASQFLAHSDVATTAAMYHHADEDRMREGIQQAAGDVFEA